MMPRDRDVELRPLTEAVERAIAKQKDKCPECDGAGGKYDEDDGEYHHHWIPCPTCYGTGEKKVVRTKLHEWGSPKGLPRGWRGRIMKSSREKRLDSPEICRDCPRYETDCQGSNQEDCEHRGLDSPDRELLSIKDKSELLDSITPIASNPLYLLDLINNTEAKIIAILPDNNTSCVGLENCCDLEDKLKDAVEQERKGIATHLDKLCKYNPIKIGALRQELGKYIQTLKGVNKCLKQSS